VNAQNIKFLGIIIDSNLSWKQNIDDIIPKLNKECFAVRSIKPFMSLEAMRLIYFPYFHSVLSYGIIIWDNSVQNKYIKKKKKKKKKESLELSQILGSETFVGTCLKKTADSASVLSTFIPYSCL